MSRPALIHKPTFSCRIAGEAAPAAVEGALSGWRVLQGLSMPSVCELDFYDYDPNANAILKLGNDIELADRDADTIFSGFITAVEKKKHANGLRRMRIRAYDKLDHLRRRQAMKAHLPNNISGHLRSALQDLDLDLEATEDGPRLPLTIQWGVSDWDWLSSMAARYGLYFFLDGDVVRLMTLDGHGSSSVELSLERDLFEASIEANAFALHTEALVCSWDPTRASAVDATAMDFSLGEARSWSGAPEALVENTREIVGGAGAQDEAMVRKVAEADLQRSVKRALRFEGLAEGDARLKPGARISVVDGEEEFQEEFVLTRVEHAYGRDSGYTSALSSIPPDEPRRTQGPAISLGEVSDTMDPDEAGRVKVRLKAYSDIETDWLSVCSLGAGDSKGLIVQPEEGDNVLVAFADDNPAQGVVLGGLYGSRDLHDEDVADDRPRPYSMRTKDGQMLRLDDKGGSVHLKSRGGVFEMLPERVVLHADADLHIEAPGKRITIAADKIDFEKR